MTLRRTVIFAITLLSMTCFRATAQKYDGLDSLLTKFYTLLATESPEAKCSEFDALIGSCTDSATRSHVAVNVFDHYREAPVMGDEEVAIHIYDNWFANGKCKMAGEFTLLDAQLFADFNRATLLGKDAPVVKLYKPCGAAAEIPAKGRCAILFFYDTACAKCKIEIKVLPGILDTIDYPVNFYAVYCGSEKKSWAEARKQLKSKSGSVRITHLWDPELKSDYLRLYGVISTPKLYMTEPQGSIIGRRLEAENLVQIIPIAKTIASTYETQEKAKRH